MSNKEEKALEAVKRLTAPEDSVADVLVSRVAAGTIFGTVYGMAKCMKVKIDGLHVGSQGLLSLSQKSSIVAKSSVIIYIHNSHFLLSHLF
jgi:hypothetical protein